MISMIVATVGRSAPDPDPLLWSAGVVVLKPDNRLSKVPHFELQLKLGESTRIF